MDLTTERSDNVLSVDVKGRIDGSNAVAFEEAVRNALDETDRAMIMDFGELAYISSAGLRVILLTAKSLQSQGRQAGAVLSLQSDSRGVQDQRLRPASADSRDQGGRARIPRRLIGRGENAGKSRPGMLDGRFAPPHA